MKLIWKIAKAELKVMFYSPVAWLILIIFSFQVGLAYVGRFDGLMDTVRSGMLELMPKASQTFMTWASMGAVFPSTVNYLYLYVPLLTMGVISRELSSGSIKLLYSSPVTNMQIILGKYLSLMIFGALLMGVLLLFSVHAAFGIVAVDYNFILCGVFGIYLLFCTYAAIGLFMSSITSYTVVSAMGTLGLFAALAYSRTLWQDVEGIRDLTYWLSISGRVDAFTAGLITTDRLIYFLVITLLFLSFTAIRMYGIRYKDSFLSASGKYLGVLGIALAIGYVSSLPQTKGYIDVTRTKSNTLTKASQEVVAKLGNEGLKIETYVNMLDENFFYGLPMMYRIDQDLFEPYLRFKPRIKMATHRYYELVPNRMHDQQFPHLNGHQRMDTVKKMMRFKFDVQPYADIQHRVDLSGEGFRYVKLLEKEDGQQTFLRLFNDSQRMPSERETTAAIKRLVMKLPTVGFVTGHNERSSSAQLDRGYQLFSQEKTFRYALINQGFDFKDITLDQDIPSDITVLLLAEPRSALSPEQLASLNRYIDRGGNLMILGEPESREFINPVIEPLGVSLMPGVLVKPSEKYQPDLLTVTPTAAAAEFSMYLKDMAKGGYVVTMNGTAPLSITPQDRFEVMTWFTSDSTGSWNELETINFVDEKPEPNPVAGEVMQPYPTVVGLSRPVNGREQKIFISSDADWLSNGELGAQRYDLKPANYNLIMAAFHWMSDGELPIDISRPEPSDYTVRSSTGAWGVAKIFLKWVFPALLLATSLLIWIRRRGK